MPAPNACPDECSEFRYEIWRSALGSRVGESYGNYTTVKLSRDLVLDMRVDFVKRMTNLQFVLNLASIFGLWFGLSVLSVSEWATRSGYQAYLKLLQNLEGFWINKSAINNTASQFQILN